MILIFFAIFLIVIVTFQFVISHFCHCCVDFSSAIRTISVVSRVFCVCFASLLIFAACSWTQKIAVPIANPECHAPCTTLHFGPLALANAAYACWPTCRCCCCGFCCLTVGRKNINDATALLKHTFPHLHI